MPHDLPVTLALALLTLVSAAAAVLALRRLRGTVARSEDHERSASDGGEAAGPVPWVRGLSLGVAIGAAGVLAHRWLQGGAAWQLVAHVDGLLLIGGLLALAAWYVQTRPRLRGLAGFVLAGVAFASRGPCAPRRGPTTRSTSNASTPSGKRCTSAGSTSARSRPCSPPPRGRCTSSCIAGSRVTSRPPPRGGSRVSKRSKPSSSAAPRWGSSCSPWAGRRRRRHHAHRRRAPRLGEPWWLAPKIVLAAGAWALYAVLMNARRASAFRGSYAAWLSIAALVLLLSVYGVVTAVPGGGVVDQPTAAAPAADPSPEGGGR